MKGVTFSVQKGGAGKSITTVHTAGALNEMGYDVLVVDLDPQGGSTVMSGFRDELTRDGLTMHEVLTDPDNRERIGELIVDAGEYDLIPANDIMDGTETKLQMESLLETNKQLSEAFKFLPDYDYVLVDCPTKLGALTNNAMVATRNLVIPTLPSIIDSHGVTKTNKQTQLLSKHLGVDVDVLAVVVNKVDDTANNETEEIIEYFEEYLSDIGIVQIPERVALERANKNNKTIFTHEDSAKTEDAREGFLRVAEMIEEKASELPMERKVSEADV